MCWEEGGYGCERKNIFASNVSSRSYLVLMGATDPAHPGPDRGMPGVDGANWYASCFITPRRKQPGPEVSGNRGRLRYSTRGGTNHVAPGPAFPDRRPAVCRVRLRDGHGG